MQLYIWVKLEIKCEKIKQLTEKLLQASIMQIDQFKILKSPKQKAA